MSTQTLNSPGSPVGTGRDDRKTAESIKIGLTPFKGARITKSFKFAREVLRSPVMRQASSVADEVDMSKPDEISFFFLHGEEHKKRRASVAPYFTPKAIVDRYIPLMHATMDRAIEEFQRTGQARLDDISLELASDVTMEIVGLTNSDRKALTRRVKTIMEANDSFDKRPFYRFMHDKVFGWYHNTLRMWRVMDLWKNDIVPAMEARRKEPRNDVMSYMVQNNYSQKGMIIEVLTYAGAGVSTTREFMIMAAWHLRDNPALADRFLTGNEEDQFAIIEEILRIEPIAGFLYRKPDEDMTGTSEGTIPKGELIGIDIRGINSDTSVVGEHPYEIDPGRARRQKVAGAWASFGDGPHRCPGAQVALHETRVYLDRLLRVPGYKMINDPTLTWSMSTQGYELRNAIITCDKV
jgi:cytochrome P450